MADEQKVPESARASQADGAPDEMLQPEQSRRQRLRNTGTEITAGVGGTASSMGAVAVLGPWAALLGPVATTALKRLFTRLGVDRVFTDAREEFMAGQLGPREMQRVVAAYDAALRSLGDRLHAGEKLRDDGFFPGDHGASDSPAHQALEGVLLKARDSYEHRKAERLGELYAWLAVHPEIGPSHGNYLIELAGRLTYVQLLLLGIFALEDRSGLPDWESTGTFSPLEIGLVAAIEELGRQELVVRDDNKAVATFVDVNPQLLTTVLNGKLLCEAMNLHEAEAEDVEEVNALLVRLGKIESAGGESTTTRIDVVVPRGRPPDVQRAKIGHQVVEFQPPTLGLADVEGEAEEV
ncbi:MAG: hypothetical protein LC808_42170 [Actinobacteria bacterium]|nr:hypothetical protein [Actinomycetota bacterium]